ncbi:MAG: trypsin-like peptidase domain-containing protein [Rickettsiaceae bacterium]|nr:trypsin-like peptidase domain-containing protein [Rickettsiaceae bacterium]
MKKLLLILFSTLITSLSQADTSQEEWDNVRFYGLEPGKMYEIEMGTGFYINMDNIITNKHVIGEGRCKNIAVRGAVEPQLAEIVAIDDELDLAILRTKGTVKRVPYLRSNYTQIAKNDILFSVGYPLKQSEIGEYLIKEAVVINVSQRTDSTNFTNIQFTDNIDHGNSGGPLLDRSSNIVGVVTAKVTTYSEDNPDIPIKSVGLAIGLDGITDFLKRNNIPYASNSTYDIFINYDIDRKVRDYVVNIHCVK